jgi:DDE superfamily endonuclease
MDSQSWPRDFAALAACLSKTLDARVQHRMPVVLLGMILARGRKTVAAWLRAAQVGREFRRYYYFLGSVGRDVSWPATWLLHQVVRTLPLGERILLALDDSPTERYGPHVEGAGVHHDPSPGPEGRKFLYGHVWVTLAVVAVHPLWGTIALPLLAEMYIRAKDLPKLAPWHRPRFRTKLEMAASLVTWAAKALAFLQKTLWVVVDGGYAKRPFLQACAKAGVTVVGRLRRDANLRSVPVNPPPGQRRPGRPRIYGKDRLSLAKRAAHRKGWKRVEVTVYGRREIKRVKTFLATWEPAGGLIRVVLVTDENGWRAFFCTDPEASVPEILEAVADRGAIEQVFHDVKEVHGAGQQQLRNYHANLAAWNLCLWLFTLIELWAWNKPHEAICDRAASPWDKPERRPSHADRLRALRQEILRQEYSQAAPRIRPTRKIQRFIEHLLALAS